MTQRDEIRFEAAKMIRVAGRKIDSEWTDYMSQRDGSWHLRLLCAIAEAVGTKYGGYEFDVDELCDALADLIDPYSDLSGMVGYRFPPNRKARAASLREQSCKAMEEADEIRRAIEDGESDSRILEEVWDCIHACEGILRKFDEDAVLSALVSTISKCERRGDYD